MLFELNLNRLHECSPILPGEKNQQNKTNPKKVSLPKYLGLLKGIWTTSTFRVFCARSTKADVQ